MRVGRWRCVAAGCVGAGMALAPASVLAGAPFSCAGAAMAGGAELLCSHTDPQAPAQVCSFSWTLMTSGNQQSVVNGSFLLPPGVQNAVVYQGSGYAYALSMPVVLCQGRSDTPGG